MDIRAKDPLVQELPLKLPEGVNIIFRCVDCQAFLLPQWIHMAVFRFRDKSTGQARALPVEICPVCYSGIGSPEYEDIRAEDIPSSTFVTLTREDYEQTRKAEKWGLRYDEKTKTIQSNLLVH